jgi:hypothetical protein
MKLAEAIDEIDREVEVAEMRMENVARNETRYETVQLQDQAATKVKMDRTRCRSYCPRFWVIKTLAAEEEHHRLRDQNLFDEILVRICLRNFVRTRRNRMSEQDQDDGCEDARKTLIYLETSHHIKYRGT